jgi:hypothetical protein
MHSHQPAPKARQLAACIIGNVLEWYDFVVFGLLTVVISPGGSGRTQTDHDRCFRSLSRIGVPFILVGA